MKNQLLNMLGRINNLARTTKVIILTLERFRNLVTIKRLSLLKNRRKNRAAKFMRLKGRLWVIIYLVIIQARVMEENRVLEEWLLQQWGPGEHSKLECQTTCYLLSRLKIVLLFSSLRNISTWTRVRPWINPNLMKNHDCFKCNILSFSKRPVYFNHFLSFLKVCASLSE